MHATVKAVVNFTKCSVVFDGGGVVTPHYSHMFSSRVKDESASSGDDIDFNTVSHILTLSGVHIHPCRRIRSECIYFLFSDKTFSAFNINMAVNIKTISFF